MAVPKFQRIVNLVKKNIESGEWPIGHQLPSQAQWRDEYNVNYGTLRQGYLVLKALGLIEGRQGEGVYVKDPNVTEA